MRHEKAPTMSKKGGYPHNPGVKHGPEGDRTGESEAAPFASKQFVRTAVRGIAAHGLHPFPAATLCVWVDLTPSACALLNSGNRIRYRDAMGRNDAATIADPFFAAMWNLANSSSPLRISAGAFAALHSYQGGVSPFGSALSPGSFFRAASFFRFSMFSSE